MRLEIGDGEVRLLLSVCPDSCSTLFLVERPAPILRDWWHDQYLSEVGSAGVNSSGTRGSTPSLHNT